MPTTSVFCWGLILTSRSKSCPPIRGVAAGFAGLVGDRAGAVHQIPSQPAGRRRPDDDRLPTEHLPDAASAVGGRHRPGGMARRAAGAPDAPTYVAGSDSWTAGCRHGADSADAAEPRSDHCARRSGLELPHPLAGGVNAVLVNLW